MMRSQLLIAVLLCALLIGGALSADDEESTAATYFQSRAFNVPILEGWEDQSTEETAQFHLASAQTTIRSAIVRAGDAIAAAEADLAALLAGRVSQPVYSDKVNLADGTWVVLVYDIDAETTASVMARRTASQVVVISFVERDPAARTIMLTVAQADDALDDPTPEIGLSLESLTGLRLDALGDSETIDMPSGNWTRYGGVSVAAMGMVFGNDSYVALQEGQLTELPALADAYNRTLLGFFITPDNSGYLALGLAVVAVILGTLVFSFFWRSRGLKKDLAMIEELAREEE